MANLTEAADAIRRLANQYRNMEAAAAALESIGSFDQAAKDLEARAAKAKAELDETTAKIENDRAVAAAELEDAAARTRKIIEESDQLALDAKARFDAKLAEAEAQAQEIIAAAQRNGEEIIVAANREADNIKAKHSLLASESQAMIEVMDARRLELAKLQDTIAELRKKMSEFVSAA